MTLRFKALPLWGQSIFAILIGMLGAFAQAPFGLVPLILVMMALGFLILSVTLSARNAAYLGFLIGPSPFSSYASLDHIPVSGRCRTACMDGPVCAFIHGKWDGIVLVACFWRGAVPWSDLDTRCDLAAC